MAMAKEQTDTRTAIVGTTRGTVKRRGLIAGAAALAAGLMAKGMSASTLVAAADGDPIVLGAPDNISTNFTALLSPNTSATFRAINSSSGIGLNGIGNTGIGVNGESTSGPGVRGTSGGGGTEDGVRGLAYGTGRGVSGFGAIGVQGNNGSNGIGVQGISNAGIGMYGISGGSFGVVGTVSSAPGFALFGVASVNGTVGFAAGASVVGAIAGQFSGPVNIYNTGPGIPGNLYVQGNQTASGTKSAAVPHPDGTHRLLYCMESPEAWFEDFGEGTITGGKAEVRLDPDFAAVVDTAKLHVFLTEHTGDHHLHVAGRSATGFSVGASASAEATARGAKATDAGGTFTYRVVAKRKDVVAERLARFTPPRQIKIAPPPVPPLPTPLTAPPTPPTAPPKKG